ncbi:MAG: protoporphyrinogen/coproporphyrinogen oxidase [Acidimicrobiia bacterium]
MKSGVVVGAGLSGLAAAYRLQQAGIEVTVLERDDHPGGRVQTERHHGYVVDTGADALSGSYSRYLALVSELGLADRVAPASPIVGLVRDQAVIDIDPRKPLRLVGSRALSLAAKVRLAAGYLSLRRSLRGLDPYNLVRSADQDDPGTSADDFARRVFGSEVADYLFDPVARLVTGGGARQASHLNVLGALKSWTAPLMNVRGGLNLVATELAGRLTVEYGASVTHVEETARGVEVSYTDGSGQPHMLATDGCVIASMYEPAIQMWPALRAFAPHFVEQLRYLALISVSLGYRAKTRSGAYIVQVPTVEDPDTLLLFLQHNKSTDRAPAGHSLISLYTDAIATDRFIGRTDAEIEEWAAGGVERLFPELAGQRDFALVTRWPRAGYHAVPGFWQRSAELLSALPTGSRVQLAGDLFGAGSMESAVRWGERAAAQLTSMHEPAQLT